MAGLLSMKLECLVFVCMIVAGPITANTALTCSDVNRSLKPCTSYLTNGGGIPPLCCGGIRILAGKALSTADRRQACRCIKSAARSVGPRLDANRAAGIAGACRVHIPFNIIIRTSTNCNTLR